MICCIIFTVTLVSMLVASIYGYSAGEPWKLIAPIDGDNNICGYTPGYEDYTHLYIGNIDQAAQPSEVVSIFDYGICVKECPDKVPFTIECKPTGEVDDCGAGSDYTTTELLSYCIPNYDSLPSSV